jgi:acyl dehydratase
MSMDMIPASTTATIANRTFDEITAGDGASIIRILTEADIELFAVVSGDVNPVHLDPVYAKTDLFHRVVAHGMWGGGLISAFLGTKLPGPGTVYLLQSPQFSAPIGIGDTITTTVPAREKQIERHRITFDCRCAN